MGAAAYKERQSRAGPLEEGTVSASTPATGPVPLVALRQAAHLTQHELADRWGCSQSLVARLEKSPLETARVRTISSYVRALGGSCRLLVELDGEELEVDLASS
jgi:hypothetical protein